MKLIIIDGIKPKPTMITNVIKTPFLAFALFLVLSVTGNGAVTNLYLKLGLLVATLRIDSYINSG